MLQSGTPTNVMVPLTDALTRVTLDYENFNWHSRSDSLVLVTVALFLPVIHLPYPPISALLPPS